MAWPNASQRAEIASRMEEEYGIPDCIGIVDGTDLIFSERPSIDGEVYFNRKHKYCLNAQLICDDLRRITYYNIGWPGSCHDASRDRSGSV